MAGWTVESLNAAVEKGLMGIKFDRMKKEILADPAARAEYDRLAPEFEMASVLIGARKRARLSQAQLAARMGTTQAAVARMESGRHVPSIRSIKRYAAATGSRVSLKLVRA